VTDAIRGLHAVSFPDLSMTRPKNRHRHSLGETMALLVLVQALPANAGEPKGVAARPTPGRTSFEADITVTDGPGASVASFALRDRELTLLSTSAADGAAVGMYRLRLDKRDALRDALIALPDRPSEPPPVAGMPAVRFTVRDRGKVRMLTASRPTRDARIAKVLTELARCEAASRAHPVATLALALDPPVEGKLGQPRTVLVRAMVGGTRGSEIELHPGTIALETAAEPKPPTPGMTPLPPEWSVVSQPQGKSTAKVIFTGASLKVPVVVVEKEPGPRHMRAQLQGKVVVRLSDAARELNVRLLSKPVRVGAAKP
jgi:hypothetical protein